MTLRKDEVIKYDTIGSLLVSRSQTQHCIDAGVSHETLAVKNRTIHSGRQPLTRNIANSPTTNHLMKPHVKNEKINFRIPVYYKTELCHTPSKLYKWTHLPVARQSSTPNNRKRETRPTSDMTDAPQGTERRRQGRPLFFVGQSSRRLAEGTATKPARRWQLRIVRRMQTKEAAGCGRAEGPLYDDGRQSLAWARHGQRWFSDKWVCLKPSAWRESDTRKYAFSATCCAVARQNDLRRPRANLKSGSFAARAVESAIRPDAEVNGRWTLRRNA